MLPTINEKRQNYNNNNDVLKQFENVYGKMFMIYCVVGI